MAYIWRGIMIDKKREKRFLEKLKALYWESNIFINAPDYMELRNLNEMCFLDDADAKNEMIDKAVGWLKAD